MDESLKGILITVTVISIFITAILNFIVIFPQEQGVSFSGASQAGYLTVANNTDLGTQSSLELINNQSSSGFNEWDITQGFMGSNALKQQSSSGIKSYTNNIFTNLKIIATQLFGANSPIVWVIGVLLALSISYLIYAIIAFIRTGK